MSCHAITRQSASRTRIWGLAFLLSTLTLLPASPALAQQPIPQPIPQPAPPTPVPVVGYRAPVIALVQPPAGQSLPQDKAVVIFRFAAGEPSDQLDASSFGVWVNGASRTALFQVAGTEAWGPLSDPKDPKGGPLAPGAYQLTARICSTRGTCGTTAATVTVVASDANPAKDDGSSRKQKLIDLLISGLRRLVGP